MSDADYTRKKVKLVNGVGINDADYKTSKTIDGVVVWKCPYYQKWIHMINRCYNKNTHKNQPRYIGCSVDSKWLRFSNFRDWMSSKDWEGKALDKDLLVEGNKIYGEDTCVFIPQDLNVLLTARPSSTAMGVQKRVLLDGTERYMAVDTLKKYILLGTFDTILEAHLCWLENRLATFNLIINSSGLGDDVKEGIKDRLSY